MQLPEGTARAVEYARLLLQVWKLEEEAAASLPSFDILFGSEGGSFRKLDRSSKYSKDLQKRLQDFEKRHAHEIGLGADGLLNWWKPEDGAFREAYRLLRLVEMEKLQRQIEFQVHERLYLQSCATKLGDRPADLKKVRKELERGGNRVRAALGGLKEWKDELVDSAVFGGVAETGEATRGFHRRRSGADQDGGPPEVSEACGNEEWRVDGILRGDFPWLDGGSEPNGSLGLRLKRKLASLDEDRVRGDSEEKALVELEIKRTLSHYKQQIANLGRRLSALDLEKGSAIDVRQKDHILGSSAIVSLRRRRLKNLLARAMLLFGSLNKPLNTQDMGAAAVENVSRATQGADEQSDSDSDFDLDSEVDE